MEETGLVVSRHRQHTRIEAGDGRVIQCRIGNRKLRPVVGDRVDWHQTNDGGALLTAIRPRKTTLSRVNSRGHRELLAANISQLIIVIAPQPATDWLLLDRYLAASELMATKTLIVLNKSDLLHAEPQELRTYEEIGYVCLMSSALAGEGLQPLARAMRDELNAMVGQSGVGKSSLINALIGEAIQETRELSRKGGQGRHTTTASTLHHLPGGGDLIDSPGVRRYAPFIENEREVENGFVEFRPLLGRCKFDNCRHLAEPQCAVKAAVESGTVSHKRYTSYVKLYSLVEELRRLREA